MPDDGGVCTILLQVSSSNFDCLYGVSRDGYVESQFVAVDNILGQLLKKQLNRVALVQWL